MIEQPAIGRALISQDFSSLTIEIPSKKNWSAILFLTVWLGGWAMGEVYALKGLLNPEAALNVILFMLVWLTGWTIGGGFALFSILRQLFGQETISIENGNLIIGRAVFGIGRNKKYDISSISELGLMPVVDTEGIEFSGRGETTPKKMGMLQFDYGMKSVKFARDIDEPEARMLLDKLRANTYFEKENFATD